MVAPDYPVDENLRLILSADQEQWLRGKIEDSRKTSWITAVLIVLGAAWLMVDFSSALARYNDYRCFTLSAEAPDYQELRDEFLGDGLKPCPPDQAEGRGIDWTDIRLAIAAFSILLIVASSLGLVRHLYLLRLYKGYLVDHRAFLKKYNRP